MRKIKLFLSLLMLIAFSVGNVWADPAAVGTTLFSENFGGYSADDVPSGSVSSSTGNRVIYGGGSVTYTSADNGTNITKIYSANLAGGTSPELLVGKSGGVFTITGIPSGDAQEITVSFKQNAQKLTISLDGTGYSTTYASPKPSAAGTVSFDITVADGADDTFSLIMTAGSSNVRVDNILVTVKTAGEGGAPAKTLTSIAVSGTPTKTSYYAGDNFDPAGLTVTGTYSDESTAPITSGITWSYDPSQELALNQTSIGVIATVSEIASPKFNVTGLTVSAAPVASGYNVDFESAASAYTDWTFTTLVSQATNSGVTAHGGSYYGGTDGKTTGSIVTKNKVANPGTLTFYVTKESNNNTASSWLIKVSTDGSNWTQVGDAQSASSGISKNVWTEVTRDLSSYSNVYVGVFYDGTTAKRCIDDIELTTVTPSAVAKPTISGETPFVTTTTVTLACTTDGASIYYTTDGTDPSSSSTLYEDPFSLTNTATVKAIAVKGSDVSGVAEQAFNKATVMTVAEARAAIDAGGDLSNKYVAGIISQIDGYNSTYHSITYWISADGLTTSDQLEVYSGLAGVVKEQFTSENDLAVGDDVTVKGTLKKYSSTYEFDYNNTIVAYKPIARLAWSAESFDAALEGENTFPTLTNTNGVTVSYSSSDPTKASFADASVYEITLNAAGSTTITASFAGNETYKANSASYTLNIASSLVTLTYNVDGGEAIDPINVSALPNPLPTTTKVGFNFGGWFTDSEKTIDAVPGTTITENTTLFAKWLEPYNITEAKSVIDNNPSGIANQYVAGIISQVDSYNNTYKSITYWISDDGSTTNQLQVYSGLIGNAATALEKTQFSAKEDLQVGDIVVVTGTLKKYGETYEFDKNNTIYSFSRPAPTYTVRFWNSEGWDEVYAYVWKYDAVNEVTTTPVAWPGQATSVVDGWNEFEVEEGYNIIFNNNKSGDEAKQTIDIENITADVCYVLTGETVNTSLAVAADNDCDDRLYVAGDEALTGDNWNTTADRLENGSITFTNIAANTQENPYKFKITNGTWNWNIGGAKVDATACDGVTIEDTDADGNVVFTIDEAKDITISYNKATDKIVVTAVTYVAPVYKAIVVSYGGKYYAMTKTAGNNGFAPLEVTVDGEGNVAVNNEDEKTSILWKFNEGTGTASFQAGTDYLAGNGTSLNLQTAVQDWTLDTADEYYYVMDGTTKRSFFYQTNDNGGIFKNYAVSNFGGEKYSGKHTLYAADKIVIRVTAKFFAPASWENVYAYTYSWDEINGTTEYNGAWPGKQLTKDGDWYAISMPIGAKVIFHNNLGGNSNQTVDIPVPASACFAWNGLENNDNPKMTVATISTCEMNYSIAGNEALTGVAEWGHTALVNNAITYNEVAVGTYKFKISNGTWDWSLGGAYVDQTACSGVTIEDTDGDGNAVFSIATKSNVTISYNPATEKISIVAVASTPEILVDKAEIAFGTVDYEDAVDAEIINVTLISVANATISLTGDADAFQLDKDALTASGIVSVTPVTTTAGTFNATLTISDAATAAEAKEIALSLTVNEAPVVDICDGTDDFDADQSGETATSYKNRITTNGWTATNAQWTTIADEKRYFTINGKTTAVGVITSPVLNGGIASLKFMYANTNNETHGVDVKIEIKQGGDVVKEYTLTKANENVAKGVLYTETIENVNVAGDFQIVFTNLSPTNSDSNKDRVSIGKLCWSNYSAPEPQYETIREELEIGRYYTICMEKNITAVKNATFWNLRYKNAEPATEVYLEETTTIEAGKPYIFQAGATTLDVIYGDDSEDAPVENGALRGTFTGINAEDFANLGGNPYLLIQNAIRPRTTGNFLAAHRAYIEFDALDVVPAQGFAPGRRVRAIPMQSNVVTGCEEINASETPVKMMINGQLFILRGEKMYDTTGRLVK